ncbi:MAG: hypothetical protein HKN13_04470 [Rhodothermales bacterium]|nr:hypothetical protein [Rhodothermales bacterium]
MDWGSCAGTAPITVGLHFGIDSDTDATLGGVEVGVNNIVSGVGVVGNVDYGQGSQSFYSDEFSGGPDDYRVIVLSGQVRYPYVVSEDSGVAVNPLVGLKYYNWNYSDCPFSECEAETDIMLELGAGVQWGMLALDAFTSLDGPNFSVRLRVLTGIG